MKKSELTQLTQVIEHLVAKEVRKQLPAIIAETFQSMMGNKTVVTEQHKPSRSAIQEQIEAPLEETKQTDFRASLKELFAGTPVIRQESQTRKTIQYAKDPVLNAILNETTSDLRAKEMGVSGAAMLGGYSPSLNMIPGFDPSATANMGMVEEGPSFSGNMPTMPSTLPISRPPVLTEGQESTHAPMEAVPQGLSVLDLARHVPAPSVKHALTRNYSQMMKLIDKKQGKI